MSVPRWISLERFAGAVYDSASHLIEVSVVLFLLSCHSDKSASATRGKSVDALTATAAVSATRAASSDSTEAVIVGGDSRLSVVLCAGDIADKLRATKVSAPTISHTVVLKQPRV